MLHVVGECDRRIFGLLPAERLQLQILARDGVDLVADASAVIDDAALSWLIEHRGTIIGSRTGRPLAVVVESGQAVGAAALEGKITIPEGEQFVRKLRRRIELGAHSLAEEPARDVEKKLFANVYKGVTDLVTKYVWPWPAFHVTRACASLGITPNMVTIVGITLVFYAAWLFYSGAIAGGLMAAWLMTFLDTVDGKLARVTATSSPFGNALDHGTDILHPPVWWYCLAVGLAAIDSTRSAMIWPAFWTIIACYVIGRIVELGFHRIFGFNQYIWRRFDSQFRLIVSRRNVILLIMTAGLLAGAPVIAFVLAAGWSVISTIVQVVRIGQALAARPITSWLY